jgi:hypothetical protein
MNRLRIGLVALLLGLSPAMAFAQAGGRIQGKVTDETGGILPGVTVEARLLTGGPTKTTVSSAIGEYA